MKFDEARRISHTLSQRMKITGDEKFSMKKFIIDVIGMSKTYVLQNPATAYSMLFVLCILYIVCFREQIGVLLIPIDVTELYWINGDMDDPEDLCLHGHAVAYIGGEKLEYDCTVSATALYLLKTLTEDHIIHEDNQMLPCCGHFYIPDAKLENIVISGCDKGIDWTVRHNGSNVILTLENGTEVTIPLKEYRQEVYRFADKIENYYKSCSPKKLPEDKFDHDGYIAFWNEWHRRRNA